ncbi:MAG: GNAT family N-acetyltransferase [Bacillota bacterium]
MQIKNNSVGLKISSGNIVLRPLKKGDYKSFLDFSIEYDNCEIPIDDFVSLQASKEFEFIMSGKLWLYLFEKQTQNRFEVGEILGYAEITQTANQNTAEVGYYIKKSKRNNGNGRKILAMAIEVIKNMSYETVVATASQENHHSVALLKSANFTVEKSENEKIVAYLNL